MLGIRRNLGKSGSLDKNSNRLLFAHLSSALGTPFYPRPPLSKQVVQGVPPQKFQLQDSQLFEPQVSVLDREEGTSPPSPQRVKLAACVGAPASVCEQAREISKPFESGHISRVIAVDITPPLLWWGVASVV